MCCVVLEARDISRTKSKETAFQGYKNDLLNEALLIVDTNSENFT